MAFLCPTCGKNFGSKAKHHSHNEIHSEKILTGRTCDKSIVGKILARDSGQFRN